ncbi:MAG: hypothetical protein AAF483_01520 [Planctomycetota bacterium]
MLNEFHLQIRCSSGQTVDSVDRGVFQHSFEEIREALLAVPNLYFEEDGSFFWRNQEKGFQVWGMLYDRIVDNVNGQQPASRLEYCELQGKLSRVEWQSIIDCLGEPIARLLAVELPQMKVSALEDFLTRLDCV